MVTIIMPKDVRHSAHLQRVVTSILGIPLLVVLILYGTPLHFWLLIAACIVIGLIEFYQMLAQRDIFCFRLVGLGLGLFVSIGFWRAEIPFFLPLIVYLVVIIPLVIALKVEDFPTILPKILGTIGGVLYIAWLLSHLIWIRGLAEGKSLIFFLLLIVWSGDAFAFYTGTYLGKHLLSPRISPKKSIEGAIGGLVGSMLIAIIAHFTFLRSITISNCLVLSLILNILGQFGDLAESLLKRGAGVKDSSQLIPGHGGMLDRMDSLLFAGPALFYYTNFYLRK